MQRYPLTAVYQLPVAEQVKGRYGVRRRAVDLVKGVSRRSQR